MQQPNLPMPGMPQPQPNPPMMPPGPFIQVPGASPSSGRVAAIQGLIFGLILAGVFIILSILLPLVLGAAFGDNVLVRVLLLPIQCVCYFLAGILASWRTGKIRTGIFASFWMNLWYLLSAIPASLLLPFHGPNLPFWTFTIISLPIALGLGAGLGALGGLVGKALNKPKQSPPPFPPMQGYGVPQQGPR